GLDCGKCGLPTCREMAEAVVEGEAVIEDCRNLPAGKARITVDGRSLPVGSFVSDVVANTIQGMVRSLKGGEDASRIEISVDLDPEE
ncbi:MAG: (Fe-S)-binding protein, partial [Methanomassiliicoccales archaeon]